MIRYIFIMISITSNIFILFNKGISVVSMYKTLSLNSMLPSFITFLILFIVLLFSFFDIPFILYLLLKSYFNKLL